MHVVRERRRVQLLQQRLFLFQPLQQQQRTPHLLLRHRNSLTLTHCSSQQLHISNSHRFFQLLTRTFLPL